MGEVTTIKNTVLSVFISKKYTEENKEVKEAKRLHVTADGYKPLVIGINEDDNRSDIELYMLAIESFKKWVEINTEDYTKA